MEDDHPGVMIVGAGFAGIATARALARRGVGPVRVVEREPAVGVHASGRNAEILRTVHEDPVLSAVCRRGRELLDALEAETGRAFSQRCGVLLVGGLEDLAALHGGPGDVRLDAAGCLELAPWLPSGAQEGVFSPRDGRIDAGALLAHLAGDARAHGVRFDLGCEVLAGRAAPGGFRVATSRGEWTARMVVNAAGAWADVLQARFGAPALGLAPLRRHLHLVESALGRDCPVVWDVSRGYYARPETPRQAVMSACEVQPHPPAPPEPAPDALEALWEKLPHAAPGLADARPLRHWACLRTLAPDGRFRIGWDAAVEGLFHVAALGGHGVTAALAVGELAAGALIERCPPARRAPRQPAGR
ncbi:MAG: FAD-dependent oxidoreductase [Candidatus Sumerlaeia bacterium]|nr:FAD-dependent oxidoreductase [Candidatus Sumerlaeia bacterium]